MDYYDEYFGAQTGGARTGYGGISQVYIGSPNQRGHGIGSFLGGLFRRIIPLLKHGARAVGKEALRSGVSMASDIMDSGMHPREAFKTRLRESGENLKRKAEEKISALMKGSGYKAAKINNLMHSVGGSASRYIGVKKRRKRAATASLSSTLRKRHSGRVEKKKKKRSSGSSTRKKRKTSIVRGRKPKTAAGKSRRKKPRTVSDIFA